MALENLVVQVEQHLEKNPTDGRGWNVLAPVLVRLGRFDDAVRAYRNSLTYNGESSERRADLGEAIAAAAGGVVTAEAKTEFERAHGLNADDPKANYFLGLAAEQDGRKDDAANIWRALLAKAPADAPWRPLVQTSLARVGGGGATMPALSDETIAASKDMNEGDRNAMVRGMVERLATRLKQNGDDVEGWLRLVRAYLVMGDRDRAMGASTPDRLSPTMPRGCASSTKASRLSGSTDDDVGTRRAENGYAMTRKQRRMTIIGGSLAVLALAAALVLNALRDSIVFFSTPTMVAEKHVEPGKRFRLGGLVQPGSLQRGDNLAVTFEVADGGAKLPVAYKGILPDLFREGQGVVAEGALDANGVFKADTVLAKHDETYMPKEVADALKKQGHWKDDYGAKASDSVKPAATTAQGNSQGAVR
jgi:cytochrome c-type biogenesis protein CcmE/cytochrome c-type biogenesis protein CcmH/NrfG